MRNMWNGYAGVVYKCFCNGPIDVEGRGYRNVVKTQTETIANCSPPLLHWFWPLPPAPIIHVYWDYLPSFRQISVLLGPPLSRILSQHITHYILVEKSLIRKYCVIISKYVQYWWILIGKTKGKGLGMRESPNLSSGAGKHEGLMAVRRDRASLQILTKPI